MAEIAPTPKRKRGRPKRKGGTKPLTFSVSVTAYDYLTWLITNSMLGPSENAIALRLLTDKLEEMRQQGYRMRALPPDDEP